MRLRIESIDGSVVNDYRILSGRIQVRSLDPRGSPVNGELGKWRALDRNDVALHRALGTSVALWMQLRLRKPTQPAPAAA